MISTAVIVELVTYFSVKLSTLINKYDTTVARKGSFKDLDKGTADDLEVFEMREQGFVFAFNLSDVIDPSIGKLTVNQVVATFDENG